MTTDPEYDVRGAGIQRCRHQPMRSPHRANRQRPRRAEARGRALSILALTTWCWPAATNSSQIHPTAFALLKSSELIGLSQFDLVHHWSEPDRRHRANPRARCTRSKEADCNLSLELKTLQSACRSSPSLSFSNAKVV